VFAQSVDLLTGRAQVSIPLWTISNADLSVPISIWHHGGALRVEEGEGSCGLGWNLSIGGAVYRQLRGLPDDYKVAADNRRGWLFDSNAGSISSFTDLPDDNLSVCTDESSAYSFIHARDSVKDTEPDIFSFSAPGLSGQFVFGTDGNPKLLVYQDLKIVVTKDANERITQFAITTNKGVTYTFANIENVTRKVFKKWPTYVSYFRTEYNYYQRPATFTGTWHLSTISSQASGQTASFSYASTEAAQSNRFVITIGTDNVPDTLYSVRDLVDAPKQLSSVTSGGYTATLTWLNNLVRRVVVTEAAYGYLRQFDFVYRGFRSTTNTAEPKFYRYFLKEIKQLHNCEPFPDYSFQYMGITLGSGDLSTAVFPWDTRHKQDYWGYYNGASSNQNIPNYYFHSAETDGKRLTTHSISGATITSYQSGYDREVNSSTCGFGALTEINYPKGGQTKFIYEPNTYYDGTVSTTYNSGGIRVSQIVTSAGEVAYGKGIADRPTTHTIQKDYEYKLSNGTSSGQLTYPAEYAFVTDSGVVRTPYPLGPESEVLYSRVTEKLRGKGKTVFEYELTGMYADASGTVSKIARSGGTCVTGSFKNGKYTFPFAPHTNTQRGFLKKIYEYDESGNLTREERKYYTTLSYSPTTINALRFERVSNGYHFSKYTVSTGTMKVPSQEISKVIGDESAADSTRVTSTYSYNGNTLLLEYVTRTNDDGSYTKEKFRYVKDYESIGNPPSTDIPEYAIKQLLTNNRHGELVESIRKFAPPGGTEKTISASLILYKNYDNGKLLAHRFLSYPPVSTYYFQSVVASSKFRYDSSYIVTRTVEEYDGPGNVIAESDNHKNIAGYHRVSTYTAPPSAVFSGCYAGEAVHENFELSTGRGFIASGGSSVTGWTGASGYQLGTLSSVSVAKRGNKYRVTCWAKASQARTVTFKAKNGATVISTKALTYDPSPLNQWLYLEGLLDVTGASSPFTLEVTADGAISVDDVTAMPEAARVSLSVYRPLVGVVAETDDRGNSATYTYDSLGRKVNTFDRKRNLVENRQYQFAVAKAKKLVAGFSSNQAAHRMGQSTTFTAQNVSCISGISYAWAIYRDSSTPVATGSGSSIAYSFANMGSHNVSLTVSHASYGSVSYSEDICVMEPLPASYGLTLSGGGSTVYSCGNLTRTFAIVHPPTSGNITYQWGMKRASAEFSEPIVGAPNSSSITITSPAENYSVNCTINVYYPNLTGNVVKFCPSAAQPSPSQTTTLNLVYQYNGPCN
jgi:YD repeat-containing protein